MWDWLSTITPGIQRSNKRTNPGCGCCWYRMGSVIYVFIPTRCVIYLFMSRVCLRSQSRTSDSPVLHWCVWWGSWLCSAEGKPGQMKELNVETRSRNIAVTGQNSLETNCSKLTQAVILLSALQERSEQEYLFFLPPSPSCPRKLKRRAPVSSGLCVLESLARRYNLTATSLILALIRPR